MDLAVSLITGQGEEAFYPRCGEVRLLLRSNGHCFPIGKLLAHFRLAWITGSCEFNDLPPRHVADRDEVV